MRKLPFRIVLLLMAPFLSASLASCQLLGGTDVAFINASAFTIDSIQFGALTVNASLGPSSQTGNYSIAPGQNILTASSQGTQTTAVLFTIVAGHNYTVTFSGTGSFSQVTVTLAAVN